MANKVPAFGMNTSCIKGIKSMYKAKGRVQGLSDVRDDRVSKG